MYVADCGVGEKRTPGPSRDVEIDRRQDWNAGTTTPLARELIEKLFRMSCRQYVRRKVKLLKIYQRSTSTRWGGGETAIESAERRCENGRHNFIFPTFSF